MKGVVLSGGHGTRLRPLTHTVSKHLIPIANKPMVYYAIEDLVNAGIKDIAVIVGHTEERIRDIKSAIGDGSRFGAKVSYIEQDAPRGIAHAIGLTEDFVGNDKFVVYLGDNVLKGGIGDYVNEFQVSGSDSTILLVNHPSPERFGVAIFEGENLVGLVEKPKNPPSNFVMSGIYMFSPAVFEIIKTLKPSWRNEIEITEAIDKMLKSGKHKVAYKFANHWWKDTGKPEDIIEANRLILDDLELHMNGTVEDGATLTGKIGLGEGSIIKRGSTVTGPVIIGENCEVGPNAHIGPYTSVGDNCKIMNCEIESSVVVGNTKIDTQRKIIDSIIGRNVTIAQSEDDVKNASKLVVGENSFIRM